MKSSTNKFSYNAVLPPGFVKGKLQSGINITTTHSRNKALACIVWAWQSLYNFLKCWTRFMKFWIFTWQFIWFSGVGVNNYRNTAIYDIGEFVLSARANLVFKCSVLKSDVKLLYHQRKSLILSNFSNMHTISSYGNLKISTIFNKQIESVWLTRLTDLQVFFCSFLFLTRFQGN